MKKTIVVWKPDRIDHFNKQYIIFTNNAIRSPCRSYRLFVICDLNKTFMYVINVKNVRFHALIYAFNYY